MGNVARNWFGDRALKDQTTRIGAGGQVQVNLGDKLLGNTEEKIRSKTLDNLWKQPEYKGIREKYGNVDAFKAAIGTSGTDALTTANTILQNPGYHKQVADGKLDGNIDLFSIAGASKAQQSANIGKAKLQTEIHPHTVAGQAEAKAEAFQQKQFDRLLNLDAQNLAQQKFQNERNTLLDKIAASQHNDKIEQANLDREWRDKESQREWEYRRRRDREDNLDDLFKVIMGGINAFI